MFFPSFKRMAYAEKTREKSNGEGHYKFLDKMRRKRIPSHHQFNTENTPVITAQRIFHKCPKTNSPSLGGYY